MLAVAARPEGEPMSHESHCPNTPPGCSRRAMLQSTSGAALGLLAAGCGSLDELGSGVCMGTQPRDAIAVTGAEHLAINQAMPVSGLSRPIYVARDDQGF